MKKTLTIIGVIIIIAVISVGFSFATIKVLSGEGNLGASYVTILVATSTAREAFYDLPSTRIIDGDLLTWDGNTLDVDVGTLTNTKYCIYTTGTGIVCNSTGGTGISTTLTKGYMLVGGGDNIAEATSTIFMDIDSNSFGIGTSTDITELLTIGSSTGNQFIVAGDGNIIDGTWKADNIDDERIAVSDTGDATYDDVQDWLNLTQSAGLLTGCNFTDEGDGDITIGRGEGFIKTTDSATGTTLFFNLSETTNLTLVDGSLNRIYIDYNSGTPIASSTTNSATIDHNTIFAIGKAYRDGTTLHMLEGGTTVNNLARRTHARFGEVYGFERSSGMVTSEIGVRAVSITEGKFYRGLNDYTTSAFDSSAAGTFSLWHDDGSWQEQTGRTVLPEAYSTGSGTTTITNNQYAIFWVYMHEDNDVHILYGLDTYFLGEAQGEEAPSSVPTKVSSMGVLIAKVIIAEADSDGFTEVQTAWIDGFSPSVVTDHGALGGLLDDDHTIYLELDGSDVFAGDLDFGGYDITNLTELTIASGTVTTLTMGGDITMGSNSIFGIDEISGASSTFTALAGTLTGDLVCTDCLNATEIEDIYLLDDGDDWEGDFDATNYDLWNLGELSAASTTFTALTMIGDIQMLTNSIYNADEFSAASGTITALAGTLTGDLVCTNCLNATEIEDIYLLDDGDIGTGVFDFGGATSFEIPNAASPTVDTNGEIALDDTFDQFLYYDGGAIRVLGATSSIPGSYASSSMGEYEDTSIWWPDSDVTLKSFVCNVKNGTSIVVNFSDGSNDTGSITCGTADTYHTFSSNNTFSKHEDIQIEFGTNTGSADILNYTIYFWRDRK